MDTELRGMTRVKDGGKRPNEVYEGQAEESGVTGTGATMRRGERERNECKREGRRKGIK